MNAFRELENEAKINLEDNQITELFHTVEEGNFEKAEAIMEKFIDSKSVCIAEKSIYDFPHRWRHGRVHCKPKI